MITIIKIIIIYTFSRGERPYVPVREKETFIRFPRRNGKSLSPRTGSQIYRTCESRVIIIISFSPSISYRCAHLYIILYNIVCNLNYDDVNSITTEPRKNHSCPVKYFHTKYLYARYFSIIRNCAVFPQKQGLEDA